MDIIHARLKVAEVWAKELRNEKRLIDGIEIEDSSGNVFADLDLPQADRLQIKSGLVIEITQAIRKLGLTQAEAARRMGVSQPKVSGMMRGDFTHLSEHKLMECLSRPDDDMKIIVKPAAAPMGHLVLAFS